MGPGAVDERPLPHPTGVGRRRILQGLVAGVGAGVAGGLEAHAMAPAVAAARAKAKAADWKPQFLDAHELATLQALCVRIVPGSDQALTDRFIDALLAVDTEERRRGFLTALGAIEAAAHSRFQKPFRGLTEAQQEEILSEASSAEPGREEWVWTPGTVLKQPEREAGVLTLRDHFDLIKGRVVEAYYSSEEGLKELGYTGQMFFESFPDCTYGDHG